MVHNVIIYVTELNNDLVKISKWEYIENKFPSKFPSKHAQDVVFSRKANKESHTPFTFNNNIVYQATPRKHLGNILYNRLSSKEHVKPVFSKTNNTVSL